MDTPLTFTNLSMFIGFKKFHVESLGVYGYSVNVWEFIHGDRINSQFIHVERV